MKLWNTLAAAAAAVVLSASMATPALAAPNTGETQANAQGADATNTDAQDQNKSKFKVPGAIGQRWKDLGGETGAMGPARGEQKCDLRADACSQEFEKGRLIWTPSNGRVHGIRGAIAARWDAAEAENGTFGYPISDENCTDAGCSQIFESGQIHFTEGEDTFVVLSPILEAYGRTGDAAGPLGLPIAEMSCTLADNGCFQTFQHGSIYYTPKTQAWFVQGPIGDKWAQGKWENGDLGFPAGDTFCRLKDEGCFQTFQNGSIYWTKDKGAAKVGGPIGDYWGTQGWELGWLGFPTGDQGSSDRGSWQTYEGGNLYLMKDTEDVRAVRGDILARWGEHGYENGDLGWPLTGEFCDLRDGGCATQFENGSIYWTPETGAHIVRGRIRDVWAEKGWENGYLGYPTSEEDCSIGGETDACFQTFQFGSIYWSRATGPYAVPGTIMKAWGAEGYERGDLGFPVSDLRYEMRDGAKVFFQEFEHGFVEYTQGNTPSVVMK